MPSAMSQRSASLSLSAILLARSTVLEKAASKVSAIGSMGAKYRHRRPEPERLIPPGFGPMFNRGASFQPHAVQPHVLRRRIVQPEQRYVRYFGHIDQAVPRTTADLLQRNAQHAPLPRRELEPAVETVDEFPAMSLVVYAHA